MTGQWSLCFAEYVQFSSVSKEDEMRNMVFLIFLFSVGVSVAFKRELKKCVQI